MKKIISFLDQHKYSYFFVGLLLVALRIISIPQLSPYSFYTDIALIFALIPNILLWMIVSPSPSNRFGRSVFLFGILTILVTEFELVTLILSLPILLLVILPLNIVLYLLCIKDTLKISDSKAVILLIASMGLTAMFAVISFIIIFAIAFSGETHHSNPPELIRHNSSINITSPIQGEKWARGSTHTIQWNSQGLEPSDKIKLDLNVVSGSNVMNYTIADFTTSEGVSALSGSYTWKIPYDILLSDEADIRVLVYGNDGNVESDIKGYNGIISDDIKFSIVSASQVNK